ncbi:MAG: hypothetical protein ACKOYC_00890 [Bacteroidota bacterium]
MSRLLGVFQTFAYRITIALVYILSGLYVALFSNEDTSQFKIVGWMIFGFGVFRAFMALKSRSRLSK